MSCKHVGQVHAYYDGELPESQVAELELHLAQCPACRSELASLERLSRLLAGARAPQLSDEALARLHGGAIERGVLRIAEALTAAAAVVLAGGAIGLLLQSSAPAAPAPWERVAVVLQTDSPGGASAEAGEEASLAQWMAQALAKNSEQRP